LPADPLSAWPIRAARRTERGDCRSGGTRSQRLLHELVTFERGELDSGSPGAVRRCDRWYRSDAARRTVGSDQQRCGGVRWPLTDPASSVLSREGYLGKLLCAAARGYVA